MAEKQASKEQVTKVCFVTTGATAPFEALIESVLSASSIEALQKAEYTNLLVQYGTAKQLYESHAKAAIQRIREQGRSLKIDGLDFDQNGLRDQFQLVQRSNGVVISHAGSGSILEALRFQLPLIVVPNTSLLGNHQDELATAMAKNNYLIRGDVENLAPAILEAEQFKQKMTQFPPITSGKHRETKSFAGVMDEMLGFVE
ncbi:glycosyltransferase family 28 C-terminal domain-domain-containing protein [Clohesyomyces aquaticus]|uniref:UDP-N-acetylglucosamine transferase subunit ALG13 n=1 Tax=Clohesyomyces aquaticus TaxID=1231657 RepID=A0A1Y1Y0Y3_9PLEO|nr:glycosyltransferase family 28 C-terminal domain-domain-containing protein [Clohesyomyces aquaticus]